MNAERLLAHYERIADAPDAIARLRRFILDLAVRGKLVPQDPNDVSASELLKQIAKEKARLAKAGEIKTPKAFSEIEGPPFDLPQNWRWTRIREVASDRGQEIPRSTFTYIDVTAIDKEAGVVASPKVLEAGEAPSRARKITRKGDVIYSCVRPYLLNVAVIETDFNPQPIASTAFAVLNGHGLVLPRYLWIVLRCPFMVALVEENQRGQAYPAINDADFAVLPFPLPPLAEQHRIVAKVDELMALCDQLETARVEREAVRDRLAAASLARLNAPDPATFRADARFLLNALPALTARPDQIERLRKTILSLVFQGRLTEREKQDGFGIDLAKQIVAEIEADESKKSRSGKLKPVTKLECEPAFTAPETWGWIRLDFLCDQIGDIDHKMPRAVAEGVPFLSAKDLKDGGDLDFSNPKYISEDDFNRLSRKILPRRDDIIYSRIGARLGKARLVKVDTEFLISYSCCLIRPKHRFIDKQFLQIFLDSHLALKQAHSGVQSIGVPDLGLGEIKAYRIPVPSLAEQHRIVVKVDALMALCDQLEASLTATATTRRRLLDALLAEALAPAQDRKLEAAE